MAAQDFIALFDHLLPERYPQIDYSIYNVAEATLRYDVTATGWQLARRLRARSRIFALSLDRE